MPILREALGPQEDWSGLKDAKARRKLQNRLNVRAHRRRKCLLSQTKTDTSLSAAKIQPNACPEDNEDWKAQVQLTPLINEFPSLQFLDKQHILHRDPGIVFPLSLDHLIPLVQYNFIRGVLTNMAILGCQNAFPSECSRYWVNMPLFPAPSTIPESLQSTALQRSTLHEPWIDLIPDKQMRDNAILAMGAFTREDVEEDVTGSLFGHPKLLEMTGMLAWDEPWRADGWEFTEGFIRKWPFLIKGCWKMLESTNRWRALRDEEPLVVEL
ncbi:hypothetical protein F4804DRAFT_309146 [Jackrogersella minutella]|nr:hypothetical protein F4804DRAFT_309146 [Jackrogersella minutella]